MNKPHKNQCGVQKVELSEVQESFLCNKPTLSKDTLSSLEELGGILKNIHRRMLSEGCELVDGCIQKKR